MKLPPECSPGFWEHFLEPVMFELSLEGEVRAVWGRECVLGGENTKGYCHIGGRVACIRSGRKGGWRSRQVAGRAQDSGPGFKGKGAR